MKCIGFIFQNMFSNSTFYLVGFGFGPKETRSTNTDKPYNQSKSLYGAGINRKNEIPVF
jgi:hypothetical protein